MMEIKNSRLFGKIIKLHHFEWFANMMEIKKFLRTNSHLKAKSSQFVIFQPYVDNVWSEDMYVGHYIVGNMKNLPANFFQLDFPSSLLKPSDCLQPIQDDESLLVELNSKEQVVPENISGKLYYIDWSKNGDKAFSLQVNKFFLAVSL